MNEWRYWPTWSWLRPADPTKYPAVKENFAATNGPEGAAFCASVLMLLQDAPIDVANFYCGDTSPWSMFDGFGIPSKVYHAFRGFNQLSKMAGRVAVEGNAGNGIVMCAGLSEDRKTATILIASFKAPAKPVAIALRNVPWNGKMRAEISVVDATHDLDRVGEQDIGGDGMLRLEISGNSVMLVRIGQGG